jgi:hypothetical protein
MKGGRVKSNLHEFGTWKIDFIRYYLAAKIDFRIKPILAAQIPKISSK